MKTWCDIKLEQHFFHPLVCIRYQELSSSATRFSRVGTGSLDATLEGQNFVKAMSDREETADERPQPKPAFKKKASAARLRSANAWMMMQMQEDESVAEIARRQKGKKERKLKMLNSMLEDEGDEPEREISLMHDGLGGTVPLLSAGDGPGQREASENRNLTSQTRTSFGSLAGRHGNAPNGEAAHELRLYMKKRGAVNTALKRRYFVLKRDTLAYYTDQDAFERGRPSLGAIMLSGSRLQTPGDRRVIITDVTKSMSERRARGMAGLTYTSQSSGHENLEAEYHLIAESEEDLAALVTAVGAAQTRYPMEGEDRASPPSSPITGALASAARRLLSPARNKTRDGEAGRREDHGSPSKSLSSGWGVLDKIAKRAASLAGSVAGSRAGSRVGSPAGSRVASREGSLVGSDASKDQDDAGSFASGSSEVSVSEEDVAADEQVLHWRAVAQEELADRLEVQRALRSEETALREALEDEERCLNQEREQDQEIEELQNETRELLGELGPLEDLVHVLECALRQRDDEDKARHAEDISALLTENTDIQNESRRLEARLVSEKAVLLRLQASLQTRLGASNQDEENEESPAGLSRYDGSSSSVDMSDVLVMQEEDALVREQSENRAALRLCRHLNSDISSVLNIQTRSLADEDEGRHFVAARTSPALQVKRDLAAMLTVSDERLRRSVLEALHLQGLLAAAQYETTTQWGCLQALQCERALVATQAQHLQRDNAHLTDLLYRQGEPGDGATSGREVLHPRSMVGLGICLRDDSRSHEVCGPIIRAVYAGTHPSSLLTRQELRVFDEIVEVDGRDVRGLGAEAVLLLLTDAPGTRSVLKVRRDSQVLTIEVKRASSQLQAPEGSSAWRNHVLEGMHALQAHQAVSELSLSFANAAGQVRGSETRNRCSRAQAEEHDLNLHHLRLANHQLLSRLKALEASA